MAIRWGFGRKDEKARAEAATPAEAPPSGEAPGTPPAGESPGTEGAPVAPPPARVESEVLLIGEGLARPLWEARLTAAGVSHVHLSRLSAEDLAALTFQAIVETDPDPATGPVPAPDACPRLAEGGFVLLPCHYAAPTHAAAELGPMASRAVGYTLFPQPDGAQEHAIEMGRALQTDDDAWAAASAFATRLGLRPESVGDVPGLIFARVVACLINDAAFALGEGIADAEGIDEAMRLGVNYPKGLLAWCDELGTGFVIGVLEGLLAHYDEDRYRVAPLLRAMHAAERKFFPTAG